LATTVTPAAGLISTVQDFAQFDLALKQGVLLRPDTLADMRRPALGAKGVALPHGLGWFVQSYNGEPIVWQYGIGANASSSLVVSVPGRGLTLVLLANSDGLVKPFALAAGNVTASPFVRLFLGSSGRHRAACEPAFWCSCFLRSPRWKPPPNGRSGRFSGSPSAATRRLWILRERRAVRMWSWASTARSSVT
jgi:hypothetical protein